MLKSTDGVNNLINNENIKVFDIKACTKFILSNEFDFHCNNDIWVLCIFSQAHEK